MKFYIESVGVVGPGLACWSEASAVLGGMRTYQGDELTLPKLEMLPPVERRRTGLAVKLAIAAGQDALAQSAHPAADLATVFTASGSDGEVINEICTTLAGEDHQVSPTRFHNSVHNAPAGYWSIATGSHAPSTSLCAFDWSFAAGLIEAASQIATGRERVLLIAYDQPYPQPLLQVRKVALPFGAALLLTRRRSDRTLAEANLAVNEESDNITGMQEAALEQLRNDNPAARALPLLAALARKQPSNIVLGYIAGKSLAVSVMPC